MIKQFLCFLILLCSLSASEQLDINNPKWFWMDAQIEKDFRIFKGSGITKEMLDKTMEKVPEISFGDDLVRLQIVNRKVVGREGYAKELLKKICEIYPVPDVDVIIHEQDIIWNHWLLPSPVLSTCKVKGSTEKMIHFPVQIWKEWENNFTKNVERVSENSLWESKTAKIFWRGSPNDADDHYNNREEWGKLRRGKLCCLSKQYPDLIDATFSSVHSWLVREDRREEFFQFFPQKQVSWEEYIQHKYLIEMDGCVAGTPGFAWKLLSNSAVFKHDSNFTVWFHRAVVPWVHYIPLENDLSDIFHVLNWAKSHDARVKQIAENGRVFAKENLMPEHLYLYCYKVLLKYASLQK